MIGDKAVIGLTPDVQNLIEEIEQEGWFGDVQDIARLAFAYSVAAHVAKGTTSGAETRWAVGLFDNTGEMRSVLKGIYPDHDTPVRLMEHFVNVGVKLLHERLITKREPLTAVFNPIVMHPPPQLLFGKYRVIKQIVGAGMAMAFHVRLLDSEKDLFLKQVPQKGGTEQSALKREIALYQDLQRRSVDHVMQVEAVERDETFIAIVLEWAEGGTLEAYVKSKPKQLLTGKEAQEVAVSVLRGLVALHDVGIVHRDLKPANILRSRGAWKIADFGIGKRLDRTQTVHTFRQAGTPGYAPPEQLDGTEADTSADMYAFGKLLVFLRTGQTDQDRFVDLNWQSLVRMCTHRDPERRPTAPEALKLLEALL